FGAGLNHAVDLLDLLLSVWTGAKAIVVYPISPTAINQVVKAACAKGVKIIAYDAEITEPCAYNVTIDQAEAGRKTA
ncbi:substrate-binding domain-containing protein, partial [Rhizobium ruizarguesonis]